ncbi:MAG: hypothetical protein LBU16_02870 [Treponema sp.]|jgi:hypothetical protein|nr:hypothetical protein [Treponema sp.]
MAATRVRLPKSRAEQPAVAVEWIAARSAQKTALRGFKLRQDAIRFDYGDGGNQGHMNTAPDNSVKAIAEETRNMKLTTAAFRSYAIQRRYEGPPEKA